MFYAQLSKQKLTTQSSTKAKLVTVDNVMGQVMWTQHFLLGQGYEVKLSLVYHDN